MRTVLPVLLCFSCLATACGGGAQLDAGSGSPPGIPLVSFGGYFEDAGAPPIRPIRAAILWHTLPVESSWLEAIAVQWDVGVMAGTGYRWTVVTNPDDTPTGLPYYFFDVFNPPDAGDRQQLRDGEPAFVLGSAIALYLDGDQEFLGSDHTHGLIYFYDPVPAGSLTAWWLGGAPTVGYHHVAVRPTCLTGDALEACAAELAAGGAVPDVDTARPFCAAPYRLQVVPNDDPGRITNLLDQIPACP